MSEPEGPADTTPDDTTPADTTPGDTTPAATWSADTTSAAASPDAASPADATPAAWTPPADTTPTETTPAATTPTASGGHLVVTSEELQASDVETRVQQMRAATAPQMVRAVGDAPSQIRTRSVALVMLLAGLVGGLVGWGASELISEQWRVEQSLSFDNLSDCEATTQEEFEEDCLYQPWYGLGPVASSVAFLTPFAVVLGALLIGWDGISSRSGAKFWRTAGTALPILVVTSVFGAWLSSEVFQSMVDDITSEDDLHLPRGVAWALAACAIGFAVGAASRSGQRMLNGAIGGAVGGFVGGFVFDYIDLSDDIDLFESNGIPNRIVGLTLTGACVGLAIGLVEHARREHWLEIVSGGMAGKQFILYRDVTTIGSSPTCDITLIKDTGIGAQHATLQTTGGVAELRSFGPSLTVQVNGTPTAEGRLSEGDLLQMGTTILRYRNKAEATPTLAAPLPPRFTRSP